MTPIEDRYVLLTTFRKNGQPVGTPMWFGQDAEGRVYMQTNAASGKIKRLRNSGRVELTPCTSRGQLLGGPVWPGVASVHDPESAVARKSLQLLTLRWGWTYRIFSFGLRLFRRKLVYLEIQLEA